MHVNAAKTILFITLVTNSVLKPPIAAEAHEETASSDLNATFVIPENHPFIVGKKLNSAMCFEQVEERQELTFEWSKITS